MIKFVASGRRRGQVVAFLICLIFSLNILQIAVAVETDQADQVPSQESDQTVQVETEEDPGLEPAAGNELPNKENLINPAENSEEVNVAVDPETEAELEISPESEVNAVGNGAGEKAFTLYKDGQKIGDFVSLNEVEEKMAEYKDPNLNWNQQHDLNFVIEVNQDVEMTENVQFGWAFGELTIKSKDPQNPNTIKANNVSHTNMISVVQGARVRIQDLIIDGNNTNRLFSVEAGASDPNATIDGESYIPSELIIEAGAVLQNGYAYKEDNNLNHGAAISAQRYAKITINGGEIKNNLATGTGGAICSLSWSPLTITGGKIHSNQAAIGGAVYVQGSNGQKNKAEITGGKITANIATNYGGGITTGKDAVLTISGGRISENMAISEDKKFQNGGGIYTANNSELVMTGGEISENQAKFGGGIFSTKSSQLTIKSGLISGNIATSSGGGAYILGDNVQATIDGEKGSLVFEGNLSGSGAGIYNNSKNTTIKNVEFQANRAGQGGALYLRKIAVVENVELYSNQANYGGGLLLNVGKDISQKLKALTATANKASAMGGGIYIQTGTLEIENSSLTGNIADSKEFLKPEDQSNVEKLNGSGGGIYVNLTGGLILNNTALRENQSYYGGGVATEAAITVVNSRFEQNQAYNVNLPLEEGQTRPNKGHGGAIYVYKKLPKGQEVFINQTSFTENSAAESGGAISINETFGLVRITNSSKFTDNYTTGKWGNGGAIYSNLHAYEATYDDGSQGPIDPDPDPTIYYININTDDTTVFTGNKAFRTFTPPPNKADFKQLLFRQTSHPGTAYDHILNNDDVNLNMFKKVIFDKNYQPVADPVHQIYIFLEGDKWGESKFPADPVRPGYKFLAWNTIPDPTDTNMGVQITADNIGKELGEIKQDTVYYAIWLKLPDPAEPSIVNPIYLPTESIPVAQVPRQTAAPLATVKPSPVPATGESGQARSLALALVLLGLGLVVVRLKSRS